MKCRVCRGPAVIDVRRHNANFCSEHFVRYCHRQVEQAIDEHGMCQPDERLLVAVAGGKDSLALWDFLLDFGYRADGLYLGLGIDGYSEASLDHTREFARSRRATLVEIDLNSEYGYSIPMAAALVWSSTALDEIDVGGPDHVACIGNVLRWQIDYLRRQRPVLPEGNGFPRKIKPLIRLGERETAAHCVIRGIDYQLDECPMAAGNRHLAYKRTLNEVELESPGAKTAFYFEFLRRMAPMLGEGEKSFGDSGPSHCGDRGHDAMARCRSCGGPTDQLVCAFCRLVDRVRVQ